MLADGKALSRGDFLSEQEDWGQKGSNVGSVTFAWVGEGVLCVL